jgi:beta-1,4-N-acetylglucosaminyltransferase
MQYGNVVMLDTCRGKKMSYGLRLLVVLGDGGHTAEMVRLVELLGPNYEYHYLITTSDHISEGKITIPGPVYYIVRPRAKDERTWRVAWNLARSFWQAAGLLWRIRPDVVMGSGPAVIVPVALLGKLIGAKVIYIENACRVTDLSLTGRMILRVADLFFVQWEPVQNRYPRTIFAGRLI